MKYSPIQTQTLIIVAHFVSRKFEICPNKGTYTFFGVTHERVEKEESLQLLKREPGKRQENDNNNHGGNQNNLTWFPFAFTSNYCSKFNRIFMLLRKIS